MYRFSTPKRKKKKRKGPSGHACCHIAHCMCHPNSKKRKEKEMEWPSGHACWHILHHLHVPPK
jgi:hypothetical protein